ncbi:MAG: flagellar motor protein MotB [Clostridiales bacterium]|nr:flagellar motor protein MotB [Clostridiales bacterium]
MAKKRQEEPPKGAPAWMTTFSDLMNLLLCFFVLLFSMSSVDEEKWEKVVASLTSSFSIFDGGASSIGEGQLINMGIAQLNEFDTYANNMGNQSEDSEGEEYKSLTEKLAEVNKQETEQMYDGISELSSKYNLDDYIDIQTDEEGYQYVMVNVTGSLLYDTGKAELKEDAIPIFSKIGDILKHYNGYRISVIGHTDNVPVTSGKYASNNELSSARAIHAAEYLMKVKKIPAKDLEWIGRGEYDPIATNTTADGRAKNRRIEIRIYNKLNSDS